MSEGERIILRVPGTPTPEIVKRFEDVTGAELVSATRIFRAAPRIDREGAEDGDGVQLTFQGDTSNVTPEALTPFPAFRGTIGLDMTALYRPHNPTKREA